MTEFESPCVRNCCLNEKDICLGCFRTLEEIISWGASTDQQKQDILIRAEFRKKDHDSKDN